MEQFLQQIASGLANGAIYAYGNNPPVDSPYFGSPAQDGITLNDPATLNARNAPTLKNAVEQNRLGHGALAGVQRFRAVLGFDDLEIKTFQDTACDLANDA